MDSTPVVVAMLLVLAAFVLPLWLAWWLLGRAQRRSRDLPADKPHAKMRHPH